MSTSTGYQRVNWITERAGSRVFGGPDRGCAGFDCPTFGTTVELILKTSWRAGIGILPLTSVTL